MSQDTSPTAAHEGTDATKRNGLPRDLPPECSVPGYWDTLAENTEDWAPVISVSALWRSASAELDSWKKEYHRTTSGILIKGTSLPNFIGKSAHRIEEKTMEKLKGAKGSEFNVKEIFDQSVPVPNIEDLVRVRLETHFLDGVPFLAQKILSLAKSYDAEASIEAKGKLSGYFAQHLTFRLPVHFRFNGITTSCVVTCEVQVATKFATLVWENSHGLYEVSRIKEERSEDWQWSPNDPRFLSRQLGHMIHLADGLFCNLRDESRRRT